MKRVVSRLVVLAGGLLVSSLALGEESGVTASASAGLFAIGSSLAIGIAALGGTLAQGKVAGSALEGIARNPSASGQVFTPMIIALALIEFQAIMGFIIAILWLGKVA
jgi:F-type H+-transporting ATPase subunit c